MLNSYLNYDWTWQKKCQLSHRCSADIQTFCLKTTQRINWVIQCDKDDVEFKIHVKSDHNASCSLAEQCVLAAA